jgi:hypothetical protein
VVSSFLCEYFKEKRDKNATDLKYFVANMRINKNFNEKMNDISSKEHLELKQDLVNFVSRSN